MYTKNIDTKRRGRSKPQIRFRGPGTMMGPSLLNYQQNFNKSKSFNFEFEIHIKLAKGSIPPCEDDLNYKYDDCIHQYIERESLAKFGCTTPFGPSKNHICTNRTISKEAMRMYSRIRQNHGSPCLFPCKTFTIRLMERNQNDNRWKSKGYTRMTLNLNDDVRISEEVFLYTGLSLIAEVGGYVGLFLGVSINQISTLLEMLFDRYAARYKKSAY